MKRILLLLIISFVVCIQATSIAQISSIVFNIQDTNEIKFLNNVEVKLLAHLEAIQQHKKKCDISLFDVNVFQPALWNINKAGFEIDESIEPKEKITTNNYELDLKWNKDLDTFYIIGFSRQYYYTQYYWRYRPQRELVSIGTYCVPIYKIPLNQYSAFLSEREIKNVFSIIKREFMKYIDDDTVQLHDSSVTLRTIVFNKSDSLSQMPWYNWVSKIKMGMRNELIQTYRDFSCKTVMRKSEADSGWLRVGVINDRAGTSKIIGANADFSSIKILEKWSFDTNKVSLKKQNEQYFSGITWEIKSIGLIQETDKYVSPPDYIMLPNYNKPIWFTYNEIETICKYYGNKLYLYKELINSALYRKLNFKNPW